MRCKRVGKVAMEPDAPQWADSEEASLDMVQTPLEMQPTPYIQKSWTDKPYGRITPLTVRAQHDGTTLAVRIAWTAVGGENPDFPDAVAFALPVKGEPMLVSMGEPDAPIHILLWQGRKSGKDSLRSVLASGIGSSRPGPAIRSAVMATRDDNRFAVVIARALGGGGETAPVKAGKTAKIGFAVWDGANEERAGIKAFSIDWADLTLDA